MGKIFWLEINPETSIDRPFTRNYFSLFKWKVNIRTSIETPTGTYRLVSQDLYGLAGLVDISISIIFSGIILALISSLVSFGNSDEYWQFAVGSLFLMYGMTLFYFQGTMTWFGTTLMQRVLGIRVITITGEPPDFWMVARQYRKNNICLILTGIATALFLGLPDNSFRNYISDSLVLLYLIAFLLFWIETSTSLAGFEKQSERAQRNRLIVIYKDKRSLDKLPATSDNYLPASLVARSIAYWLDIILLAGVIWLIFTITSIIYENGIVFILDNCSTCHDNSNSSANLARLPTMAVWLLVWPIFGYVLITLPIFNYSTLLVWGNTPGKAVMGIRIIKTNGQAMDDTALQGRGLVSFIYLIVSLLAILAPENYYYPIKELFQSYFNVTLEWFEIPLIVLMVLRLFDFSLSLVTKKRQSLRDLCVQTWLVKAELKPSYYESKPPYQD